MQRVIATDTVSVGSGDAPPGSGTPGEFTSGNPGVTPPTVLPGWWLNLLQKEVVNIPLAVGMTLDKASSTQLYQGILALRHQVDTGSVNALAVTPAAPAGLPADTGLPDGFEISIVPAFTSTTTTPTFAWNGGTPRTIVYPDASALGVGDIPAGLPVSLKKTGGGTPVWWLTGVALSAHRKTIVQLSAAFTNLTGSSAGSVKTASWTADQVVAAASLGGTPFFGSSLTFNFNGATNGANGMAGVQSFPAAAQLDIYAIYNPTTNTWACLGNAIGAVGAKICPVTMPAGYVASILIGSFITSGSNFVSFSQIANGIYIQAVQVVTGRSVSGLTATSISTVVPTNAKACSGYMITTGSNTSGALSDAAGNGAQGFASGSGGVVEDCFSNVPVANQTIYTTVTGSAAINVDISGYLI